MSPATQIQNLVKGIGALADSFQKNCPGETHRLHVRRADWNVLRERPDLAGLYGFVIDGDRILYRGLELRPTGCGASHDRGRK
jgi:hypothetical protein